MTEEIKVQLKELDINLPSEVGEVVFCSKYNRLLLKNIAYLKFSFIILLIILIILTRLHLMYNDNSWSADNLAFSFIISVYVGIFLIKCFFCKFYIRIAGSKGCAVYIFRFMPKRPEIIVLPYKKIENLNKCDCGEKWWRRHKSKYCLYEFIVNHKVVLKETIYTNNLKDDTLDFVEHILDNWPKALK